MSSKPDPKVVDLRLIQQSQEPAVHVDAQEAREDSDGRLIWAKGETSVFTAGSLDPRRFDAQIAARYLNLAASWAAGANGKKGDKLARKLRKMLKKWEA